MAEYGQRNCNNSIITVQAYKRSKIMPREQQQQRIEYELQQQKKEEKNEEKKDVPVE